MSTEVVVPGTSIAEYSKTQAALAILGEKYKGVLFDVSTREGRDAAVKARAEIRRYRVDLEKTRVEIKAPALKRTQEIDSEARRITAALLELETPIDDQIKADERRKAAEEEAKIKAEAERVAAEERARREAEEKVLAAQRAEIERQQAELAAKRQAQEQSEEEARRRIWEEQKVAREKIEAEQRAAREQREAEEAKARQERMEIERREREVREAEEARQREIKRKADELLDMRAMLKTFRERYGKIAEVAAVVKAIDAYLQEAK